MRFCNILLGNCTIFSYSWLGFTQQNVTERDRQDFCIGLERYWLSITVPYKHKILSILSIHV